MIHKKWDEYQRDCLSDIDDSEELFRFKEAFYMGAAMVTFNYPKSARLRERLVNELDDFADSVRGHLQASSTASSSAE